MAEIVAIQTPEQHTVGTEQSGSTDFVGLRPSRRTIGDHVLRASRTQNGKGDRDHDRNEGARHGDKGPLDENRRGVGVKEVPPQEKERRVIDRPTC